MASKKRKVSKVRAYCFSKGVVIARSVEDACARYEKETGEAETKPVTLPARFAY
jgi:hypothetical protein